MTMVLPIYSDSNETALLKNGAVSITDPPHGLNRINLPLSGKEHTLRNCTVLCSAEGSGGSVYHWRLPLRAQLLIGINSNNSWALSSCSQWLPSALHRTQGCQVFVYSTVKFKFMQIYAYLCKLLIMYANMQKHVFGPFQQNSQNPDFPKRKSALNWYCILFTTIYLKFINVFTLPGIHNWRWWKTTCSSEKTERKGMI